MRARQNVFVQVFNKAAGVAIPDNGGYRFVSAKRCFRRMERQRYQSIAAIEAVAAGIYARLFLIEPVPVRVPARNDPARKER
jgi:hypothetical protein